MTPRIVPSRFLTVLALAGGVAMAADAARPGPAGPTDFDFLEGRWNVVYNNAQPGIPPDVTGTWTARKEADGRVLYDEFRLFGPNRETVVLGTTYRVFDHVEKKWDMRYVGLSLIGEDGVVRHPAHWAELSAWREGSRLRVDQRRGRVLLRITYYDMSEDHFRWQADVSTDGGKTWTKEQIRIEATRVTEPPARPAR
ncbi:MAG: hypothetical protein ACRDHF_06095 [Tepidiformaceae bacterium]